MNVDDYLKRINYKGSKEPTLEVLKAVQRAHVSSVPYSNFGFHGGPRSTLDYKDMYNDIVTRRQGNTCFRCNGAFSWLIRNMGFKVRLGQARIYYDNRFYPDYTHLTPVVEIDGSDWLADAGYLLYEPVRMDTMKAQVQPHGIHRIRPATDIGKNWYHLERFKKTVLDKNDVVLKQGPRLPGNCRLDGDLDCEEMKTVDPKLWTEIFAFNADDHSLSEFEPTNNEHQDDPEYVLQNVVIVNLFVVPKIYRIWFSKFVIKEMLDPITDKILEEREVTDDKDATELSEKYFKVKLDYDFVFFKNQAKKGKPADGVE